MTKRKGLTKVQLDKMQTYLLERQHWLQGEVRGRLKGSHDETIDRGGDEADQATMSLNSDLALDARARESRELQLIEQALQKISDGSYGLCEECSETIAIERLQALPFAPYCIDCQERFEEEGVALDRREFQPLE